MSSVRILIVVLLGPFILFPVKTTRGQVTDERVRVSLEFGVKFLKSRQQANGNWPAYADTPAGLAGLCTLALINAGATVDDPAVSRTGGHLCRCLPRRCPH